MMIVGFPLYHQVPASWFANWLRVDQSPLMGSITVNGAYITTAMTSMVQQALELDGWDRLVVLEHDVIIPADGLVRIAAYEPGHAVVGGLVFAHQPPHCAYVYVEQDDLAYNPITPTTAADWVADPMLYRCDAVGFGFTSIARHVLEHWDPDTPMFNLDNVFGSHDFWFCHHARAQGHHVYVDTGIICEHLTQVPIGLVDNQRCAHTVNGATVSEFSYAEP
jgi:hypothetical protein